MILPFPARQVAIQLEAAGARALVAGPWEGSLVLNCGWWHTRTQLSAVADAVGKILQGADPQPVPPDRYDRLPNDLAWRQLDSIQAPQPEEIV